LRRTVKNSWSLAAPSRAPVGPTRASRAEVPPRLKPVAVAVDPALADVVAVVHFGITTSSMRPYARLRAAPIVSPFPVTTIGIPLSPATRHWPSTRFASSMWIPALSAASKTTAAFREFSSYVCSSSNGNGGSTTRTAIW
jgi:hypothetical protein